MSSLALAWIKEGLRKRSITRDLKWGVPVPLKGFENKIFYVWFDAPIGYISSTKEWAERSGDPDKWKDYWLDPKTRIYNFLGKDNIPFHTIFWPGMLMANGDFNLPYDVVGPPVLQLRGGQDIKVEELGHLLREGRRERARSRHLALLPRLPHPRDEGLRVQVGRLPDPDQQRARGRDRELRPQDADVRLQLPRGGRREEGARGRGEAGRGEGPRSRSAEADERAPGGEAQGRPEERPPDRDNRQRVFPEEPALGPDQGRPRALQAGHLLLREHLQGPRGHAWPPSSRLLREDLEPPRPARARSPGREASASRSRRSRCRRSRRSSSRRSTTRRWRG